MIAKRRTVILQCMFTSNDIKALEHIRDRNGFEWLHQSVLHALRHFHPLGSANRSEDSRALANLGVTRVWTCRAEPVCAALAVEVMRKNGLASWREAVRLAVRMWAQVEGFYPPDNSW